MWHASAASTTYGFDDLDRLARKVLHGVGDAHAGEWTETFADGLGGTRFVHVRRRLTPIEERHVGPAVDLRGTPEERRRAESISRIHGVPADVLIRMG